MELYFVPFIFKLLDNTLDNYYAETGGKATDSLFYADSDDTHTLKLRNAGDSDNCIIYTYDGREHTTIPYLWYNVNAFNKGDKCIVISGTGDNAGKTKLSYVTSSDYSIESGKETITNYTNKTQQANITFNSSSGLTGELDKLYAVDQAKLSAITFQTGSDGTKENYTENINVWQIGRAHV